MDTEEMTADEHFAQVETVARGRMILTGESAGTYVPAETDLYCRAHNVFASQNPEHFREFGERAAALLDERHR